jgi:hypothetical protein
MAQIIHESATTIEAVCRAIQHSQESLRALAKRYGINQKRVAKWKGQTSAADLLTGPKEASPRCRRSKKSGCRRVPTAYGQQPLDDCLYALQPRIPYVTRSPASVPAAPRHLATSAG